MNEIKSKFSSALKLKKLYFKNIEFKRNKDEISSHELKMGINKSLKYLSKTEAEATLNTVISASDQSFTVSATLIGNFELLANMDDKVLHHIMETNTFAIMFPYLRSQISLITSQPDMTPVVIPAININALVSDDGSSKPSDEK